MEQNHQKKERKKIDKERELKLRQKIQRERQLLEKEKSEILSIIDELSEINYKRVIPQTIKEENIQPLKKENNKNQINYNNIDYEAYTNNENYSDDYYDIKGNKSELIDGVYFETPYN